MQKLTNSKTLNTIIDHEPINILEISKSREKYFKKICKHTYNCWRNDDC